MKRILLGSLFAVALAGAAAPTALAGEVALGGETGSREQIAQLNQFDSAVLNTVRSGFQPISPFSLVYGAYNGKLKQQGIPSFQRLIREYSTGSLEAEDLVRAAIAAGRLTPNALDDKGYINAVADHLDGLQDSD